MIGQERAGVAARGARTASRAARCAGWAAVIAVAGLAWQGVAVAQTSRDNVTLYGVMDLGLFAATPGPSSMTAVQVMSGQALSRWGIRGREDLGGGLSAFFTAEAQVYADEGIGQAPGGGMTFQRRSFVGLDGGFGSVKLGRDYTPGFFSVLVTDLFAWSNVGNASAFAVAGGTTARTSNAIFYDSPTWGGFRVMTMYGSGERYESPRDAGSIYHLAGFWSGGGLQVTGFYGRYRTQIGTTADSRGTAEYGGGLRYDAGGWKLVGGFAQTDPGGDGNNVRWWNVGAEVNVGVGSLSLQYAKMRVESGAAYAQGVAGKSGTIGAMYSYPMSKRTNLYVVGGVVNNNQGGRFGLAITSTMLNASARGENPRTIGIGIRHFY
ncbi:MAG: porin [Burkholderiaceae bacterium]